MRKITWCSAVLFCAMGLSPRWAVGFESDDPPVEMKKMKVTLIQMEVPGGVSQSEKAALETDFLDALEGTGRFDIVSREEMDNIVKELKFQASDMVDQERSVELGKLFGVDHFVKLSVRSVGGLYQITAKLISVETGEVERIVVERCEDTPFDFLTSMCNEIAYDIAGIEDRKGSVRIESTPPEAEVFLLGVSKGLSPMTLRLAPGAYVIGVKKSGFELKTKKVRVASGKEALWKVQLGQKKQRKIGDYLKGDGAFGK